MKGRRILRPNVEVHLTGGDINAASMKGRRILRPNATAARGCSQWSTRFNEGPENSPAKPSSRRHAAEGWSHASMKGRRILRPNRVDLRRRTDVGAVASMKGRRILRPNPGGLSYRTASRERASMKGRRILRPNSACGSDRLGRQMRFNEGPENSPAKPERDR